MKPSRRLGWLLGRSPVPRSSSCPCRMGWDAACPHWLHQHGPVPGAGLCPPRLLRDRSAHSPSATALSPPAAPKQLCTAVRAFPEVPLRWLGWRIPVLWLGTAALPFPFRTAPQPAAQQGLAPGGAFMPIAHFALF